MRILIAGCGYLGLALGAELVRQGHSVVGLRRTTAEAGAFSEAGIEPAIADLAGPDFALPGGRFDWVVFAASPGRAGTIEDYRAVYLEGLRHLLARLRADPPAKFVLTGSTSVYAQQDGSLVKENSPTEPTAATDRVLLESETLVTAAVREHRLPGVVLRLAGLYGPGRLPLLDRFVRNEVKIAGRGLRHVNMIHRDDAVAAVVAALRSGRAGECYNVVDQEPVTEIHFYTWLAETLGKWVPPFTPADDANPERPNRRVSNRRLTMELGCRLKHPTFRQGYTAEIKALTDAGQLNIAPEER